jgi:hypothetical protein
MSKKAHELKKEKYTVQVNYSDEAMEKKLMKFITPSGDEFEISADEMVSMLVGQVNSDTLEATFVESERVHVVEVERQIRARADRDIKAGEEIRMTYIHPYPVEFAIIEEAAKLAKIRMDVPALELTVDYIKSVKEKLTQDQHKFVEKVYAFFNNLRVKK